VAQEAEACGRCRVIKTPEDFGKAATMRFFLFGAVHFANVCFWHKADAPFAVIDVRFWG
jgi:hypothetical protein